MKARTTVSRRMMLAAAAATAAIPTFGSAALRAQQGHVHPPGRRQKGTNRNAPPHTGRYANLVASAQACLAKGEACMKHCVSQLTRGDTSLVDCMKVVSGMLPICRALERYAAIEGKHLQQLAQLCITVNSECEEECRKHADHHETCKECADACSVCIAECRKLEQGAGLIPFGTQQFRLTSHTGSSWSSAACAGRPIALFFGYTSCPSVCPTTLLHISQGMQQLGERADALQVYFVTVDPQVDTPDQLAAYLANFDRRIVGLTASEDEIDRLAQAFGAHVTRHRTSTGHAVDHTTVIYLMDRQGVVREQLAHETSGTTMSRKLANLISASG